MWWHLTAGASLCSTKMASKGLPNLPGSFPDPTVRRRLLRVLGGSDRVVRCGVGVERMGALGAGGWTRRLRSSRALLSPALCYPLRPPWGSLSSSGALGCGCCCVGVKSVRACTGACLFWQRVTHGNVCCRRRSGGAAVVFPYRAPLPFFCCPILPLSLAALTPQPEPN